jgi:hypothetical protein
MLKLILIALFPLLFFFGDDPDRSVMPRAAGGDTGTLRKMIVANGRASLTLDMARLSGGRPLSKARGATTLKFDSEKNAFFTALVFNGEFRGLLPSAMGLAPLDDASLPGTPARSDRQLVLESLPWGGDYQLIIRDANTGFIFFNIEGEQIAYEPADSLLTIDDARLLVSKEYAASLGRKSDAGTVVGSLNVSAVMQTIELTQIVEGDVSADVLPPMNVPDAGTTPGPDVVVGDLSGLAQFGSSSGTQVGLAVATDSCNFGDQNLHWFQTPDNDHPVIPQNLYRMSGGASNTDRFEQIGQSSVKHAFTALTNNICGLGCNGVGGSNLGSGCSDPYSASLNAGTNNALGSRAWINPFTGVYPRADTSTPPNSHTGHTHTGPSHRILTEMNDLNTNLNAGAKYYAEGQYITPHEYVWCQSHAGQCNMYNNVSHRRFTVTGTGSPFAFNTVAAEPTVREKPAISEWVDSTAVDINPAPGTDGIGQVAYKVTNPSPGVWHYEYAIYNQNLDRAIQSFSVPLGAGVVLSTVGFHMPPQHPGWSGDGTVGNAGFSSAPWAQSQADGAMTWSSETFAQNPNANALRWGTLYNFRFDSNRPPAVQNATIGFFKTGAPINVAVQAPLASALVAVSGRVTTTAGDGIAFAKVTITGGGYALTNSFGYFSFDNIANGTSYTISVSAKRYSFTPQVVQVNSAMNVNFIAH